MFPSVTPDDAHVKIPSDSRGRLPVLLEGWVLQDGNYDDFVAGTQREFALEFYTPFDRPLRHVDDGDLGLRATGSYGDHEVTARVVFDNTDETRSMRGTCWVLDFGTVMAYDTHTAEIADGHRPRVGDLLRGIVSLAVDHFAYFERLAHVPDVPALIYTWDVERIEIDETPREAVHPHDARFGPHLPPGEGPIMLPDLTREQWHSLPRTRMWDDKPDGAGLYRLHCSQTGATPAKTFTAPQRTRD